MSDYNEKLRDFYNSYSSDTTYENCNYGFLLSYILRVPRSQNFWSQFGSLIHDIMEKYFTEELEIWDLADYYREHYCEKVTEPPPPFMKNAWDEYYQAGLKFLEEFDIDRNELEIINTEEYVKGVDAGIGVVVKPDLIYRDKKTNDVVIMDFKTSEIYDKKGKLDKKKLEGYKKQIGVYIYYLAIFKNILINKAKLLFVRSNTSYEWEYDPYEGIDYNLWFIETVKKIQQETEWKPNPSNKFFCQNLCSVYSSCEYRPQ